MLDYEYGLALAKVQPSVDIDNLENTLELRFELLNHNAPLRFSVERYVLGAAATVQAILL
jgi:hypothetical protein